MALLKKSQPKKERKIVPATRGERKEDEKKNISVSVHGVRRAPALLVRQAWITEKAGLLARERKYVFIVERNANKSEVKKAIEGIYNVKVAEVNIINTKGKKKRLGRSMGRSANHKKAMVSLKEGNTIDIMPH